MNGYTIEGSIDLLERDVKKLKDQGGGSGTTPTAQQVTYNPSGTSLVATNVQAAITELDLNVSANVEDIENLQTDVTNLGLDKQDKLTVGSGINIINNVISGTLEFEVKTLTTNLNGNVNVGINSNVYYCLFSSLNNSYIIENFVNAQGDYIVRAYNIYDLQPATSTEISFVVLKFPR